MTDQDRVRRRNPNAVLQQEQATYEYGHVDPKWPEVWVVYDSADLGKTALGIGPTPADAWRAAAIKAETGTKMEWVNRLVERLEVRGYQRNDKNEVVRVSDGQVIAVVRPDSGTISATEAGEQIFNEAMVEVN